MAVGISTACYYPLETELSLEEAGKAGSKATEIFFNSYRELKPSFTDLLCDIRDEYGMRIPAIHTFTACADTNMFYSDYPRRFDDGIELMKMFFSAANVLGAEYIVMHGDKNVGKLPDEAVAEHYMIMAEEAKKYGVYILQENVNKFKSAEPEFIRSMRELTDDNMLFCFDVKQAVRSGYTPDEILEAMGDRIRHIHISDHNQSTDCLLPRKGRYNFEGLFERMRLQGYCGDYMIEVYSRCYNSYDEIRNSLISFDNI